MDSRGEGCFQKAAAWIVDTPLGSGGSAHRGGRASGPVDHGHHAAMDLDWFRRVGGYDAGFSHNEDAELDHRLRRAGGHIWLAAELRLDYWMRPSPARLARQYWNYGRGRARTVCKHGMRPRLRQIAPAVNLALIALGAALAVIGLAGGSASLTALGLAWPALYLGVLALASAGFMAVQVPAWWVAGLVFGAGVGLVEVAGTTRSQEVIPAEVRGRVMGALMSVNAFGLVAGAALASRPLSTQALMLGLGAVLLGLALSWKWASGNAASAEVAH